MRLTSRFGRYNAIRKDRPLTNEELMNVVPSVFSEDKHDSRSDRYTYIPTITLLDKLREEGFQPARPAFVMKANAAIPNTCCGCVGKI